jgi:hypothetical protein
MSARHATLAPIGGYASLVCAMLLALPAVAQAQWRAEATVAARAAQATAGSAPAARGGDARAGTTLTSAAAWSLATRGPWRLELAGDAGHEGLSAQSGGDAHALARLAWTRGRAGLLLEGGGVLGWRVPARASAAVRPDSEVTITTQPPPRERSMPATVRGVAGALGGWTRLGGVLLTATARTSTAGLVRGPLEPKTRMIDSVEVRSHFDSARGGVALDTVRLGRMAQTYHESDVRRLVQSDLAIGASAGRGALDLALGGGVRHVTLGGAGEGWATARATLALRDGLGLSLQASRLAADAVRALPARHELQLGVLLRPWGTRSLPVALPAAAAPAMRRFVARPDGDGQATLTVDAPGAHTVEVMGDFTSWRIVPLERTGGGRWRTTLPLSRGVHQLNLRIDGGAWVPPPGLGVGDDGFGGRVGVLVL